MAVDVETATEIARPREEVAAYACDPDNAPEWYENIKAVEWETQPPVSVGSRMAFVATFLGRGSPTRTRSSSSCPASAS